MNEYENEELDAMAEEAAEREETELAEAETPEEADAPDTAADEQEAASTPSEQDGGDEDASEAETPQDAAETAESAKPKPPTMEEKMLEMLLRDKHPDTLNAAIAKGKTIRGAWNYVVSVMKNAYIAQYGRVNGGMCGNADVVVAIAERYLRDELYVEGYTEPEAAHTPKKAAKPSVKNAKAEAVKTAKAAAKAAKKEAKQTKAEKVKALFGDTQLSFNF